jgi:hypothetical protein
MSTSKSGNNTNPPRRTPRNAPPISLETVRMIAPTPNQADAMSTAFTLEPVDFESIRSATEEQIGLSARALEDNLDDAALRIHLDRIVNAFVKSAHGSATFYSAKVTTAREETSKLANEYRDEDRDGVLGFDTKAERARAFAAKAGLTAYALLAAATGAVDAFETITGNDWKPYSPKSAPSRSTNRMAAEAEMGVFER